MPRGKGVKPAKLVYVVIRVDDPLRDRLNNTAYRLGLTNSEAIRRALETWLMQRDLELE